MIAASSFILELEDVKFTHYPAIRTLCSGLSIIKFGQEIYNLGNTRIQSKGDNKLYLDFCKIIPLINGNVRESPIGC